MNEDFPILKKLAARKGMPIVFFDIESTGLPRRKSKVGIVEFGYIAVLPDGRIHQDSYLIDPGGIPIDEEASKVHGITYDEVMDAPEFPYLFGLVSAIFEKTLCMAFNGKTFDLLIIKQNLERYGLPLKMPARYVDVRELWCELQRTHKGTLNDVANHYGIHPTEAHRALGDSITTAQVVEEMIFEHGSQILLGAEIRAHALYDLIKTENHSRRPPRRRKDSPRETIRSRSIRAVFDHIRAYGRILPSDFDKIAQSLQVKTSNISFAVAEMLANGTLAPEQAEDNLQQALVSKHLHDAVRTVGCERLKPLKEKLDQLCGVPIDYVQIRIALLRNGYWKPRLAAARAKTLAA